MLMRQVEELMKINSLMGYSRLQYAVKRTDEIIHYNDLYSQLNYVVGYNLIENNTLKYAEIYYKYRPNILVEAPPPPPPPFEQSYPINFDNNTIGEQNFKHLHLSKNKEYLWNGNVIQNEELYEKIFPLMGSDTILYISYDANVSFGSLTAIIYYIDEIKKNRLDSFIEKNDINLSSLEYYNISEYKRIQNQFRLRKKVLTAFYSKDYFKWE